MYKHVFLGIIIIGLFGCVNPPYNYTPTPIDDVEMMDQEVKVAGSLTGTALGQQIGQYTSKMDNLDRQNLAQIFQDQPNGLTKRWQNIETQIVYGVTPTRSHQYTDGSICREYVIEMLLGNDVKEFYGRACRQTDGSWVVVN